MKNFRWVRAIPLLIFVTLAYAQPRPTQPSKAQPPKTVRLYVLDGGSLNIPDTSPYQLKKEDVATSYMSVACFLIVHTKGTMIWHAGAVPDSTFKPAVPPAILRIRT